jgi:hypothetical protein
MADLWLWAYFTRDEEGIRVAEATLARDIAGGGGQAWY